MEQEATVLECEPENEFADDEPISQTVKCKHGTYIPLKDRNDENVSPYCGLCNPELNHDRVLRESMHRKKEPRLYEQPERIIDTVEFMSHNSTERLTSALEFLATA